MKDYKKNWLKDKYLIIDYNGARIKHIYTSNKTAKQIRRIIAKDLVNYLVNVLHLKKEDFKSISEYIKSYNKEVKTYGETYEKEYLIDYVFDLNEHLNLLEKKLVNKNLENLTKTIKSINK